MAGEGGARGPGVATLWLRKEKVHRKLRAVQYVEEARAAEMCIVDSERRAVALTREANRVQAAQRARELRLERRSAVTAGEVDPALCRPHTRGMLAL